uniref:C2H2-type domain-containing protein n=1 Tax=Caenorhabditis tropicalis TaxID=1561998 RepID=A0A1I7TS58_9PELO
MNQTNFANELEALRKESWASTSSADEKMQTESKESLEAVRKVSCLSDSYYDIEEGPKISDPNPHINLGKNYQARVKKWCDRQVPKSELDSLEDRDEIVFASDILKDIDPEQITAFEELACSQACPRAGRNKELALHLLMENKGNIEAAVEDLLRSDTLDWEHYSTVFGYMYNDTTLWTPDEIFQFQDALYKSEKDFDKVAFELAGKSVKECVQFYYSWKKDCPDDYRKLRNLRRKRQLLDINLQKNKMEDGEGPPPKKKMSLDTDSDNESNATDTSFVGNGLIEFRERAFTSPMMSSPREEPMIALSPMSKDLFGIQKNYQPSAPRAHHIPSASASKKGAQPSADGFFHCRLCDKCFEKVKSLNAHMKSHAMKARAEQEAKAHDAQVAAQLTNPVGNPVTTSPLNPFTNGHLGISIPSTIGSLTPQQLTPQQLNISQQLQTQLNSLSSLSSQLGSPLTPQQQLQQFTQQQQQLVARAMQQNLFQPVTSTPLVQSTHSLIPSGLHSIN